MGYKLKKRNYFSKSLAAALVVCGGVFIGYFLAGGVNYINQPQPVSQPKPLVKTEKRQTLEDIINSSQKIVMKATYEIPNPFNPDAPKEVSLYGFGSSICLYKNLDENNLFFLTCDHVTAAPEEVYVMNAPLGFKKIENNMYETKVKVKDQEMSFYVLLNGENPLQIPWGPIQLAKLKEVSLGIYQGVVKDYEGNIKEFKTVPLTELADTDFKDDGGEEWVKNNDISLLRVNTSKMKEDEVYSQLNKFSVWSGKWADFNSMKQGDLIKVVGYPLALERHIDSGELTSKEGTEKSLDENFYFTSAHINPGNSGGPAFLVLEKYKLQDGQIVKEQEFLFAGLARLTAGGEGMGGILRPDIIKEFLKEQGYGYLIK